MKRVTNESEQPLFGASAHYWPDEVLPFLLAATCLKVVLKESRKGQDNVRRDKGRLGRHGCQAALGKIKLPLKGLVGIVQHNRDGRRLADELQSVYERHRDGTDWRHLERRIEEFIKLCFNNEADQREGRYKVGAWDLMAEADAV